MILVVDDDDDSLRIIETILRGEGFEVALDRNAADALERAEKALPELIILDILMPGMSGVEALEKLRTKGKTARIPVILLTAKSQDEDVLSGYRVGADYYMTKPFTAKQLLYGVRLVLGKNAP